MKIKMLVMDVDGTLTDGKIYIGENGEVMKAFNVKDGYGIVSAKKQGIMPVIITGRIPCFFAITIPYPSFTLNAFITSPFSPI